jgi:hypothetical protein
MLGLHVGLTVRPGLESATELPRSAVKISAIRANRLVTVLWVVAASNDRPATGKPTQNRTPASTCESVSLTNVDLIAQSGRYVSAHTSARVAMYISLTVAGWCWSSSHHYIASLLSDYPKEAGMKRRTLYSLSAHPLLIRSELTFKTGEMMLASAQVIGYRTNRMALAGPAPNTRDSA